MDAQRPAPGDDRYRILFEHSSDAHLLVLDGGILDCNEAAVSLLGCASRAEVLRIHPAELSPSRQPDGRDSLEKSREMDAMAHARGWHRFEWVHRSKQGEDLPVEVTLNSVPLDGRQGLIAVWHDLREIKRRERELRELGEALQAAHDKLKRDLEAAARIQAALLPRRLPVVGGLDIAWEFLPADELAGDILNVFLLDDDHLAFYVLDVSGHGVAASLMSVTASHFLSPLADASILRRPAAAGGTAIAAPADVAARLNQQFPPREGAVQFLTLFYGVLHLTTRRLDYTCAAHPGAVLLGADGTSRLLEHPGLPIGVVPGAQYADGHVVLEPGDRLFVLSDGIPEARRTDGTFYGTERLVEVLQGARDRALGASVEAVVSDVTAWCAPDGPQDDVSLLGLGLQPAVQGASGP